MRKLIKGLWYLGLALFSVIYILSCFTKWISPDSFGPIAVIAMCFPYLFLAMTIFTFIEVCKRKKVAIFFVLIWGLGIYNAVRIFAFHPHGWKMEKNTKAMRILTWNVAGWNNRQLNDESHGDGMIQTIKDYAPDVLCLQEYANDVIGTDSIYKAKNVLDSLGYKFSSVLWYTTGDAAGNRQQGSGVAIYSKENILIENEKQVKDVKGQMQGAVYMDFVFDRHPIRIISGRLSSYYMYTDTTNANKSTLDITIDRKRQVQKQLQITERVHETQIDSIRKVIDNSPLPAIYCGDMNSVAGTYNYYLMKGNLQDAFLNGGFGIGATFYNIVPTLRIDMCFVDPSLKVIQSKVIKRKLSDHYPVVTDILWK